MPKSRQAVSIDGITYLLAGLPEERESAWRLVLKEYQHAGYCDTYGNFSGAYRKYAERATVLIAQSCQRVIGTISVVSGLELALPLDETHHAEMTYLRAQGMKLFQAFQLAIEKNYRPAQKLFLSLFKFAFHFGLSQGFDLLCIAINPKHSRLYAALGFRPIGSVTTHPVLNHAPALTMALPVKEVRGQLDALHPFARAIVTDPYLYKALTP